MVKASAPRNRNFEEASQSLAFGSGWHQACQGVTHNTI
jgi:hypothetical protein